MTTVLEVRDLVTSFGPLTAVAGVSLQLQAGRTTALVGESGSGKSVCAMSIMGLVQPTRGEVVLEGRSLSGLPASELRKLRGNRMAMVFQDPLTALNPVLTVGAQAAEPFRIHRGLSAAAARVQAIELLQSVKIPEAERRLHEYPHQFSGGMRQRVGIAMALALQPAVLIADEPTTALDVTIQAQILELMRDLQRQHATAILLITHDMGVVAQEASDVIVMYAGHVVEKAATRQLFQRPRHPYTAGLMASVPRLDGPVRTRLYSIPGQPPDLRRLPPGCPFAPRCLIARDRCRAERPPLVEGSACFYPDEAASVLEMAR